jgi:hypothetical protein
MKSTARELLKAAAGSQNAGKALGAVLRGAGRTAKAVVGGAGQFGAGVAEGAGLDPMIGTIAGSGTAVALGVSQAGKAKRKVDEWRYRHGLYPQQY